MCINFKAYYFNHTSPLNASIGYNLNYVWRSMWATQSIVKSRAYQRIGNEEDIHVWIDSWLPAAPDHMVSTLMYDDLEDLKVSQLIDRINNKWDEEPIRTMFNSDDQNL